MRKGTRTISRACVCGCGECVPPYVHPKTGRVEYYPRYVPGHGHKVHAQRLRERYRDSPESHPSWLPVGSKRLHNSGRGLIYVVVKTAAGWEYEHRVVMAQKLGRMLTSDEDVHHRDENTQNNSPDNLEVLHHTEHRILHLKLPAGWWSMRHECCVVCGETSRAHASRGECTRCYQRLRK